MPWQVLDYQVFRNITSFVPDPTDSFLTATIMMPTPVPGGQVFRLERINVAIIGDPLAGSLPDSSNPAPCVVQVFDQYPIQPGAVPSDLTLNGLYDVADNSAPITLQESDQASFVFSYPVVIGPPFPQASLRVQYVILGGSAASAPTPIAGSGGAPVIPTSI